MALEKFDDFNLADRGQPDSAELCLWRSVLEVALFDLHDDQKRGPALDWITSRQIEIGSCSWVCDQLGLSHGAVVRVAERTHKKHRQTLRQSRFFS